MFENLVYFVNVLMASIHSGVNGFETIAGISDFMLYMTYYNRCTDDATVVAGIIVVGCIILAVYAVASIIWNKKTTETEACST